MSLLIIVASLFGSCGCGASRRAAVVTARICSTGRCASAMTA